MKTLPLRTRFAKRLGFETKAYKKAWEEEALQQKNLERRKAFLTKAREEVLQEFPETKAVFEVQDAALRFYSDVLIATPTGLNTNRRNELRAKATALASFDYIDLNEEVPAYSRAGRQEEASLLKTEELQTLRQELNSSFEENARVRPGLLQEAYRKYAEFSVLYFKNEEEALNKHPELRPLAAIKKQAKRYFGEWVLEEKAEKAVKDCLDRAIKDIARNIPPPKAEEIKAEALALRSSFIGTQSNVPRALQSTKKNKHPYQGIDFMRTLIGKNGVETGWWPYRPGLLSHTDRINNIDEVVLKEQWKASFYTGNQEEVLEQFPKLAPLYSKLNSAIDFYKEKMAPQHASEAAKALLMPDFDKLIKNETLQAVSEIPSAVHEQSMERIKHQLQIEGKSTNLLEEAKYFQQILNTFNRIQELQFNDMGASNEMFNDSRPVEVPNVQEQHTKKELTLEGLAEQIRELKEQLLKSGLSQVPLDELLQKELDAKEWPYLGSEEVGQEAEEAAPSISLSALRSTAPELNLTSLFSGHFSKTLSSGKTAARWDIAKLTEGLKASSEELAIHLLGEPQSREKNQLRFGNNKGSLIVTIKGEKAGLWYDHQTGEGGNLLQLIQKERGLSFKEALDYAGGHLKRAPEQEIEGKIDLSDLKGLDDKTKEKIARVREMANKSLPIDGTVAKDYLTKVRGIDSNVCNGSLRFLPALKEPESGEKHRALLILSKNIQGQVQGAQAIFLDKSGQKLNCSTPKRSYGVMKGAAVPIHSGGNILALAESAETALSIASANKDLTVFASLGSMSNFSSMDLRPQNNTIVVFADHDHPRADASFKMNKAADELAKKGFNVLMCRPKELGRDFNDVLRERGLQGLKEEMDILKAHSSLGQRPRASKEEGLQYSKKFNKEQELEI